MNRSSPDFPVFWGHFNNSNYPLNKTRSTELENQESIWDRDSQGISLWIQGTHSHDIAAWTSQTDSENRPVAFAWGHPRIASDADFGPGTQIETIPQSEVPGRICQLFEEYGTAAFALLEGNFSLILADPRAGESYLVVDKFGCDDIYFHRGRDRLSFSSHPAYLRGTDFKFDARAVAFFLAQEGFVPAPFTLFKGIETVGRAKFLRTKREEKGILVDRKRYWEPSTSHEAGNSQGAISGLYPLLESAVAIRQSRQCGFLLSGGVDSSLLFQIASRNADRNPIAMTGSVKGHEDGELEIASARELASTVGIQHETIVVYPDDETLPDEWDRLTESWLAGSRVTIPIFQRLAQRARSVLGKGNTVISGQMADTLADNNYTHASLGYTFRRAFYSPLFLRLLPLLEKLAPARNGATGDVLCTVAKICCGSRVAEMIRSVLGGVNNRREYYDGRVFGYGEMPGRSSTYFPSLTGNGFEEIADWYSTRFVAPIVSRLQPTTFHRNMFELSLDMVMLHLDARLVFHVFRLEGVQTELPFLDARVVNYFVNLPNSARSIIREPKHVIRAQARSHAPRPKNDRGMVKRKKRTTGKSADELLMSGSLGAYFRELIVYPETLNQVHGIFDYVDEGYAIDQIRAFREGKIGVNMKFISRLAALEKWRRMIATVSQPEFACAKA
ncbi:MAG TPA: asparagine synthase-related protein [Candidatus Acidoferrales bacterium]|nr:asparagine synthase-related protein [Candidatus Acidoferrales bacterium]